MLLLAACACQGLSYPLQLGQRRAAAAAAAAAVPGWGSRSTGRNGARCCCCCCCCCCCKVKGSWGSFSVAASSVPVFACRARRPGGCAGLREQLVQGRARAAARWSGAWQSGAWRRAGAGVASRTCGGRSSELRAPGARGLAREPREAPLGQAFRSTPRTSRAAPASGDARAHGVVVRGGHGGRGAVVAARERVV